MPTFATDFLSSYTDEALLDELRRVAALLPEGSALTRGEFTRRSGRVSASTLQRRFGGWWSALERAGLEDRYGGPPVSAKMRAQPVRRMTDQEVLEEIRRVAGLVPGGTLTVGDFGRLSAVTSAEGVRRRFGSWEGGLLAAGVPLSIMAKRYSDRECFENLIEVWTHFGRAPRHREMSKSPSRVGPKAYVRRWGTWRKALAAFVGWTKVSDAEAAGAAEAQTHDTPRAAVCESSLPSRSTAPEDRHEIPLRLKWRVHLRDRFRCVACGRSPATELGVELHADHIVPWADGGKTVLENLQTLCKDCNLGKGRSGWKVE